MEFLLMINLFFKNALKKVAIKAATDKEFRNNIKKSIKKTQELSKKGELMKGLGKKTAELKNKIKKMY